MYYHDGHRLASDIRVEPSPPQQSSLFPAKILAWLADNVAHSIIAASTHFAKQQARSDDAASTSLDLRAWIQEWGSKSGRKRPTIVT
jgi:hypothetical protein